MASFFETRQQRAALLIAILGLGLVVALWPYFTALIGVPVLYVLFAPVHAWLVRRRLRPALAAAVSLVLAVLVLVVPGAGIVGLLATGGQDMAQDLLSGPFVEKLRNLQVGTINVGEQIQKLGATAMSWLGQSAVGLLGAAARTMIQVTITLFGLYYVLVQPGVLEQNLGPFIPFSRSNAARIFKRFKDVTISTLIGVFATALVQGLLVGVAFWAASLPNPAFWAVVTMIVSILPVVGSGLVWLPAAGLLFYSGRTGWAIALALWGVIVIGNIDNLIRPWAYSRYAQLHPFITVLGAFAGVAQFGLIGLIIGPLAIVYFFELLKMYREEYIEGHPLADAPAPPAAAPPAP